MSNQLTVKAIDAVLNGKASYCKFLSANDSGETGGHQVGVLISKTAKRMMFTDEEIQNNHIIKKTVKIKWQDDITTESCFTWYESKGELRITRLGRGFPYLKPEYTGALFILINIEETEFEAYILNEDDSIQQFLNSFGMTPAETNRPISLDSETSEESEKREIDYFIESLLVEFPKSSEMSNAARMIVYNSYKSMRPLIKRNPDKLLLEWTDAEYRLFRAIEHDRYGDTVKNGFHSVDDFVVMANKVLNRRKSRAGKSLEHHLSAIFDGNEIKYTAQAKTEGNKKPDFLFPSEEAYHDATFDVKGLCTLAAKTTCKDRWRQILNEANRLRDDYKYLCTLQQGISSAQMDEMYDEKVILVVPKPYISSYPKDKQSRIWTIKHFVDYIKELELL